MCFVNRAEGKENRERKIDIERGGGGEREIDYRSENHPTTHRTH